MRIQGRVKRVLRIVLAAVLICSVISAGQDVSLNGTVNDQDGSPVQGAEVGLINQAGVNEITDENGEFSIVTTGVLTSRKGLGQQLYNMEYRNDKITLELFSEVDYGSIDIYSASGQKVFNSELRESQTGDYSFALPQLGLGIYFVRLSINSQVMVHELINIGQRTQLVRSSIDAGAETEKSIAAELSQLHSIDTLLAVKEGFEDAKYPIESYSLDDIEIVMESFQQECEVPEMPSFNSLQDNSRFPDPFTFMDGTKMSKKSEWECRRAEISALAQEFLYGHMPPEPDEVTGSMSGSDITVTITDNGKRVSFTCSITQPYSGSEPYPALIGVGGSSLSSVSGMGVASIDFPNGTVGGQNGTRAQGVFFDLYGTEYSDGSLMAWAWGVDRLIDALEKTPEAGINPEKLAVTGCSRNGKGALAVGAFCERIALTIPQESGAGGTSNWRVAESIGSDVQGLSSTTYEQPWFASIADQFNYSVDKLPIDQHEVVALVAPRPILVIDNIDWEWLCHPCNVATSRAAFEVWDALGVPDRIGFSQPNSSHMHCSLPSEQEEELEAFISKFLLDEDANTSIMDWDSRYDVNMSEWVDWSTPDLE